MRRPHLWDWGPPTPQKDATPAATGVRIGEPDKTTNPTQPMPAPAHHAAPRGTSEVAARRIAGAAGPLRQRIHAAIVEAGTHGLTDNEGESLLSIKPQTWTPRRGELVKLGLVVDSGERRPTSSGRPAAVWIDARLARSAPRMAPAALRAAAGSERGQA